MSIEIIPGRFFHAQWFIPGAGEDFLGALYRDADGPWIFVYQVPRDDLGRVSRLRAMRG